MAELEQQLQQERQRGEQQLQQERQRGERFLHLLRRERLQHGTWRSQTVEEWRRANQRLAQLQADHAVQVEVVAVAQHALAHAQQAAADAVERQQQQEQETEQLRDEPQLMAPNLEPGPGPQTLIDLLPTRTLAAHEVGRLPDSSQRCSVCLEDID